MFARTISCGINGLEGYEVHVETDISDGLPSFIMVGYLAESVREAQERVRTAIRNSGMRLPPRRITVNLSPAGIRKAGTAYDLAIAAGVLCCMGELRPGDLDEICLIGELALDGALRPVSGILSRVDHMRKKGITHFIVPAGNLREALLVENIHAIGISALNDLIISLQHPEEIRWESFHGFSEDTAEKENPEDFADLQGQQTARLASEAAVAGRHHILYIGPAGTGKTMAARRLMSIMPPMTNDECISLTRIYSVCGLLDPEMPLIRRRPFRAPHHSVSTAALMGGGLHPKPGEITLAQNGVLFLDELPEFPARQLDLLRQPLEDGSVMINRYGAGICYPAHFLLVCAMNPCKCGFFPDRGRCTCSPSEIERYLHRISGPFLDRIDIGVEVPRQELPPPGKRQPGECSSEIKKRVIAADEIQQERFAGGEIRYNGEMRAAEIKEFCQLDREGESFLQRYTAAHYTSARGCDKLIRVARTLADLRQRRDISVEDLAVASSFRSFAWKYWKRG